MWTEQQNGLQFSADVQVRERVWEKDEEWKVSGKDTPCGTCELHVTIKVIASCTLYLCVCVRVRVRVCV